MRTRFFIIGSLLLAGLAAGFYLGHRGSQICVTPTVSDVSWELEVSNMTIYPWTPDDPSWFAGDGEVAAGEQCVSLRVSPGDTIKINGRFRQDPAFWLYMNGSSNVASVTVNGRPVVVTNVSWGPGSDGQFVAP